MKKHLLLLQILIFTFMQIAPAYSADGTTSSSVTITTQQQMPKNYRLPDMYLLDSTAFYFKLKDQVGKRMEVEGFVGRFGATFGKDFKQKIYDIERQYNTNVKVILTLTSTMEDAKILKARLETPDRPIVIVEIPDWLQQRLIEQAAVSAQGKLKQMYWHASSALKAIPHIGTTATNAVEIIKNQYVKPDKGDVKIGIASAIGAGLIASTGLIGVGISDITMMSVITGTAMATLKITAFGAAGLYGKTLSNLMERDIINELKIMSGIRRFATDIYYGIGSNTLTSFNGGGIQAGQFLSESVTSGIAETAANKKTENITDSKASSRMFWGMFGLSTAINIIGGLGFGGPVVVEYGLISMSTLQVTTLAVLTTLFFGLKYKPKNIEKIVATDIDKIANVRLIKLLKSQKELSSRYGSSRPMTCASVFQ